MDNETALSIAVVGGVAALTVVAQVVAASKRPYAQVNASARSAGGTMLEYDAFMAKLAEAGFFKAEAAEMRARYRKNYAVVRVAGQDRLNLAGCYKLAGSRAAAYILVFETEKDLDKALRGGSDRMHRLELRKNLYVWFPDAENSYNAGKESWPELTFALLKATRKSGGWLAPVVEQGQGSYSHMLEKSGVVQAVKRVIGA